MITFSAIVVLTAIFGFLRNSWLQVAFYTASKRLHEKALEHVAHSKTRFFDANPSGRIINRFLHVLN